MRSCEQYPNLFVGNQVAIGCLYDNHIEGGRFRLVAYYVRIKKAIFRREGTDEEQVWPADKANNVFVRVVFENAATSGAMFSS